MAKGDAKYQSVNTEEDGHHERAPRIRGSNTLVLENPLLWGFGVGVIAAGFMLIGFVLGALGPVMLTQPSSPSATTSTVFDALSALPKLDPWKEYGLNLSKLNLYPKPLGKRICIVNVDTRTWSPSAGIEEQDANAWGWMNHYLYAKMHGYDYKFVKVPEIEGLFPTWVKVKEIHRLTMQEDYDFIVFTDADIIFPDLRLPLEPLLGRWNITKDIALAAASDPPGEENNDLHGNLNLNTGFLITQNTPEFDEMMRAWMECPTDIRYPRCSVWSHVKFHEQSALSSYVRYDYAASIREINYSDANSPWGTFIKHYWLNKTELPEIVKGTIVDRVMPYVLDELVRTWSDHNEDLQTHPPPPLEPSVYQEFKSDAPWPTAAWDWTLPVVPPTDAPEAASKL